MPLREQSRNTWRCRRKTRATHLNQFSTKGLKLRGCGLHRCVDFAIQPLASKHSLITPTFSPYRLVQTGLNSREPQRSDRLNRADRDQQSPVKAQPHRPRRSQKVPLDRGSSQTPPGPNDSPGHRWVQANNTAEGRWLTDRSAGIRPQRRNTTAGGNRRRTSTRAAAWDVVEIPRIMGRTKRRGFSRATHRKFIEVGFTNQNPSCLPETLRGSGLIGRNEMFKHAT